METVTVFNRTTKILQATWDGKPYNLLPGKRVSLPLIVAEAAKRQNILMGSEDPITGNMVFLVGIEEHGDDCSPIEQSNAITRMDRAKMYKARPEEVVRGDNGIYSVRDVAQSLPLDTAFTKP